MQPAYLPWLGYFHRIACSDVHIVLDDVEIDLNSKTKFANRNKVRTTNGSTWLTVPLKTRGRRGELYINDIEIDDTSRWAQKHWATIRQSYSRAPFFREHAGFVAATLERPWTHLVALARTLTDQLLSALDVKTHVLYSSAMHVPGRKDELILNLCKAAGATTYLSGPFGRDYLDVSSFDEAGVKVRFHDYRHPSYPQVYPGFEPYMSAIDLLFNCGPESRRILSANYAEQDELFTH